MTLAALKEEITKIDNKLYETFSIHELDKIVKGNFISQTLSLIDAEKNLKDEERAELFHFCSQSKTIKYKMIDIFGSPTQASLFFKKALTEKTAYRDYLEYNPASHKITITYEKPLYDDLDPTSWNII